MRKMILILLLFLGFVAEYSYPLEVERLVGEWELISITDKRTGEVHKSKKGIYCRFYSGGSFVMTNLDTKLRTVWRWEYKEEKLVLNGGSFMVELKGKARFVTIEEPTELKDGKIHLVYEFYRYSRYRDPSSHKLKSKRSGPFVWTFE